MPCRLVEVGCIPWYSQSLLMVWLKSATLMSLLKCTMYESARITTLQNTYLTCFHDAFYLWYRCVHFGEPRKRSKGARPTQRHFSLNCSAQIYVSFDTLMQKLVVRKCELEHNHSIGPHILPHYPSMRCVDINEVSQVKKIIQLAPKPKLVKHFIMKKYGKQVTLKGVQNIRTKLKVDTKNEVIQMHFTMLKRSWKEILVQKVAS